MKYFDCGSSGGGDSCMSMMVENPKGCYVLSHEHEAEVDRLKAELAAAREEIGKFQLLYENLLTIDANRMKELAKLRALCAARPRRTSGDYFAWEEAIDAAGRGEGV